MFRQFLSYVTSAALVMGTMPAPLGAQPAPAPSPAPVAAAEQGQVEQGQVEKFSTAQLEALLASIALYPDALLTQLLMATTNPLEIVAASRWLEQGTNKDLKGKALEDVLKTQPWDPSVKSLVPFPQVLGMLNQQLEWTQQLGFAMQVQQAEVFDAIQRLRAKAQAAGNLQSTPQQTVRTEAPPPAPPGATDPRQQVIAIEPAQPDVVYVPSYNPTEVFGAWPYADLPPVYFAPSPGYGYPVGGALVAGLVFGAGVAIAAGLWGWARPNWGCCWGGRYGGVNVNVNRWNAISANRPWRGPNNGVWRPNNPGFRPGGGIESPGRPGRTARRAGCPAAAGHRAPSRQAGRASRDRPARSRQSAGRARESAGESARSAARGGAREPARNSSRANDRGIVRVYSPASGRGIVQACCRASDREIGRECRQVRARGIGPRYRQVQDPGIGRRDHPARDRDNGRAGSRAWVDRAAIGRRRGLAAGEGARAPRRRGVRPRLRAAERDRASKAVGAAAAVEAAAAVAAVGGVGNRPAPFICPVVSGGAPKRARTGGAWCSNRLSSFARESRRSRGSHDRN